MSTTVLKLIALTAMFLDHLASLCLNSEGCIEMYVFLRTVGRIAFPIFCFTLIEGYLHTSNLRKYLIRMTAFCFISEIPFDLAFSAKHSFFDTKLQNVFFTLTIGLFAIRFVDWAFMENKVYRDKEKGKIKAPREEVFIYYSIILVVTFFACVLAEYLNTDYGVTGIILIMAIYLTRNHRAKQISVISFVIVFNTIHDVVDRYVGKENVSVWAIGDSIEYSKKSLQIIYDSFCADYACTEVYAKVFIWIQLFQLVSLIFIAMYNKKPGKPMKYLFYIFYPAHLLVLYLFSMLI